MVVWWFLDYYGLCCYDGGDSGGCSGRVLHSTEYVSGGDWWLFKCCITAMIKCSLCDCGSGIEGVEVMGMLKGWY